MTLKSDAKFFKKLIFGFNMAWGFWWILMQAVAIICTLMCYVYQKYVMFEPYHWRMMQNLKRNCLVRSSFMENDKMSLVKFWSNTRKSRNLHFNGLLLTKVYVVWAKNVRRSYASLRTLQTLEEKWLAVS